MEYENSLASQYATSSNNPISSQASLLGMDRISTLPDSIVHHIYNFMPTTLVARTSTLSKRFENLFLSYPVLVLSDVDHYRSLSDVPIWDELTLIRTELLSARVKRFNSRHDIPRLEKLKIFVMQENINTGFDEDLSSEIDRLIYRVAQGGTLKDIDLQFLVLENPHFPNVMFPNPFSFCGKFYRLPITPICLWCKSLQHLKLVGCLFGAGLSMREQVIFPTLKKLYIRLCIVGDDSISNLINGCPELEELSFKYCSLLVDGALRFSSPKLKHFVLGCCLKTMVLDIFVPSLERFKFVGKGVEKYLGVKFLSHHVIRAPNLQTLCFKCVKLDAKGIRNALSTYINLKELEVICCKFKDKPNFVGKKLEKLEISECWFGTKSLRFCASSLPVLKSLFIHAGHLLQTLVIACPDSAVRVEDCDELIDLVIST